MFDFDFCNALPVRARVGSGTITAIYYYCYYYYMFVCRCCFWEYVTCSQRSLRDRESPQSKTAKPISRYLENFIYLVCCWYGTIYRPTMCRYRNDIATHPYWLAYGCSTCTEVIESLNEWKNCSIYYLSCLTSISRFPSAHTAACRCFFALSLHVMKAYRPPRLFQISPPTGFTGTINTKTARLRIAKKFE